MQINSHNSPPVSQPSPHLQIREGFFGWLKSESFCPCERRVTTIEQFIEVADSYILWYAAKRIKVSLGSMSLVEFREGLRISA